MIQRSRPKLAYCAVTIFIRLPHFGAILRNMADGYNHKRLCVVKTNSSRRALRAQLPCDGIPLCAGVLLNRSLEGSAQPKRRGGGGKAHKNTVLTFVERGGAARSFHVDGTAKRFVKWRKSLLDSTITENPGIIPTRLPSASTCRFWSL